VNGRTEARIGAYQGSSGIATRFGWIIGSIERRPIMNERQFFDSFEKQNGEDQIIIDIAGDASYREHLVFTRFEEHKVSYTFMVDGEDLEDGTQWRYVSDEYATLQKAIYAAFTYLATTSIEERIG
jgi:hypothetical protein